MAIYKRGKNWWVRFTSPSGKLIRQSSGTQIKEQAQEFHDRLKSDIWRTDALGDKPDRTWKEATEMWLRESSHKTSIEIDERILIWLEPYLGHKRLSEINRQLIMTIGEAKLKETSASTANRYLALLRSILKRACYEWEWIDKAPKVRLFKIQNKRVNWLTHEQADNLLSLLPPHQKAMAAFALATGLRQRNVSLLEWSQIDIKRNVAWIHPDQAKAKKAISVFLNESAMKVLTEQKGQHKQFVFVYKGKSVWQVNTKAWRKAVKKAGLDGFRWHDLRHTWASWHIQSGTPLYVLQELGGWSSAEMVRRYAHLSAEHLAEHAERITQKSTNLAQT